MLPAPRLTVRGCALPLRTTSAWSFSSRRWRSFWSTAPPPLPMQPGSCDAHLHEPARPMTARLPGFAPECHLWYPCPWRILSTAHGRGWSVETPRIRHFTHLRQSTTFDYTSLIIPECECLERLRFPASAPQPRYRIWIGDNSAKGIGIFSYSDLEITLHELYDPTLRYVVPIKVNGSNRFNLLAVWANK